MEYKIHFFAGKASSIVSSTGWNIPFDPANTDYQRFKNEIQGIGPENTTIEPVGLQDANGNVMTLEQVNQFIATLP